MKCFGASVFVALLLAGLAFAEDRKDEAAKAQQALESWADLHVGGAWVPSYGGSEHAYQWMHNKRFLLFTAKDENSTTGIIGIDPATKLATW